MKISTPLVTLAFWAISSLTANAQGWEWAKSGRGNIDEYGTGVVTDASGNVYVCGLFNSSNFTVDNTTLTNTGCNFPHEACETFLLLKFDSSGNLLWAHSPPGTGGAVAMDIDSKGNLLIGGEFYGDTMAFGNTQLINHNGGKEDFFVTKLDTAGNVLWARSGGGTDDEVPTGLKTDAAGNVYLCGYFSSPKISFGNSIVVNDSPGKDNIFLVKYDADGNEQWAAGGGGTAYDQATSVAADNAGNVYLTGYFNSPSLKFGNYMLHNGGGQNMFLAKYDEHGNVVWAQNPGPASNVYPQRMSADGYGSLYVTGYIWGKEADFGVAKIINGGTSEYTFNAFVARFDVAGNVKWVKCPLADDYTQGNVLTTDVRGDVYIAGTTLASHVVFDGDTTHGDIFMAKYDSAGRVKWTTDVKAKLPENYPYGITVDAAQNVYMTGTFASWYINFGTHELGDTNNFYLFIAKYVPATTAVPVITQAGDNMLYPNPANTQITISSAAAIEHIAIMNVLGQTLYSTIYNNTTQAKVDISAFPPGTYIVKVNDNDVRKFVKK